MLPIVSFQVLLFFLVVSLSSRLLTLSSLNPARYRCRAMQVCCLLDGCCAGTTASNWEKSGSSGSGGRGSRITLGWDRFRPELTLKQMKCLVGLSMRTRPFAPCQCHHCCADSTLHAISFLFTPHTYLTHQKPPEMPEERRDTHPYSQLSVHNFISEKPHTTSLNTNLFS